MLSIGEDSIHAFILSRLDVAKDGFLQLLRGMRDAGAVHQISLGEDARKVLGDGKAVAVVAFLLSQFGFVNNAQSRHDRTGINYLLHLGSNDIGI